MNNTEKFRELRKKAEKILQNSDTEKPVDYIDDVEKLVEEVNIYHIEMEMQNQTLYETNRKLAEEQQKYKDLYMNAPVAYFTLNSTGNIIELNHAAANLLELPIHSFNYTSIFPYLESGSKLKFTRYFKQVFASDRIEYGEIIFLNSQKENIHAKLSATTYFDDKRNEKLVRCAVTDQSTLKRYENEIEMQRQYTEAIKKHETIVATTNAGIAIADTNGQIFDCNQAFAKMMKATRKEILASKIQDYAYKEDIEEEVDALTKLTPENPQARIEKRYVRRDGKVIWGDLTSSAVFDKNGEPEYFIGVVIDVTDKKQAEQAMRQSEERYKKLAELTFEGIVFHKNGIAVDVNPAFTRIFGYSVEDLKGENLIKKIVHPDYHQVIRQNITKKIALPYEVQGVKKDGSLIPVEIEARDIFDGENTYRVAAVRDITERKQAEKIIKTEREQFFALLNSIPEPIYVSDFESFEILFSNHAHTKIYGHNLIGQKCYKALHKKTQQCDFCQNTNLRNHSNQEIRWEKYDEQTGKTFSVIDKIIWWHNNRKARFQIAFDITEQKKAQQKIQQLNNRLEASMSAGNMAWWEMELPSGNIIFNENKAKMLGREPEEFTHYSDFMSIVHPADYQPAMQAMYQLMERKKSIYTVEYRIKTVNNEYLWFHDIGKIVSRNGDKIKLTGIVTDITARRKAEEQLQNLNAELVSTIEEVKTTNEELDLKNQIISKERQALKVSEERFRKVIEHLPLGLVELNHQGKIIEWNQAMEQITGIRNSDVKSRYFWDIAGQLVPDEKIKAQTIAFLEKEIPKALQSGQAEWLGKTVTNTYRTTQNEIRQVEALKFLIPDSKGNRIATIMQDITERLKNQKALKESEQKIRTIVKTLPDLLFHFDRNGQFLSFYQESPVLLAKPSEFLGKTVFEIFDASYARQVKNCIDKTFETGSFEYNYTMALDTVRYFRAKYSKLNENEVIALVSDVTQLKKQEEKITRQNQDLKEVIGTKNKFFNIIAHDLKNPFNSILGLSEMLNKNIEKYDLQKTKIFVEGIYSASKNTYQLLENLLQWARAQQGKIPFNPGKKQLLPIIHETIVLSDNQFKNKQIDISHNITEDTEIYADSEMVKTIVRNLVSNAIKYSQKGGTIRISSRKHRSEVEIIVTDNGVGMNKATQQSLFKIGETQSLTGTAGERGTGFGLMICKEFVEKHNGKIWVESEPNKGSAFHFTIPKAK